MRAIYRNRQFESEIQAAIIERITPVMDKVFAEYASKKFMESEQTYAW